MGAAQVIPGTEQAQSQATSCAVGTHKRTIYDGRVHDGHEELPAIEYEPPMFRVEHVSDADYPEPKESPCFAD